MTGKPAGDDLREGKRTVLVALTRETLDEASRQDLDDFLGDPGLTPDQVATVQSMIRDSGALARVEALISAYTREADDALADARLDPGAVADLRDLAQAATVRSA